MDNKITVHMIGQAHLDPVWLWRWTEGRAESIATSKSAADRLDEYPEFEYTRGEAIVYKWIKEEDPELFARILAHIKSGRWHVVNGMLVQPDMNLPCGESFIRQIMSGKKFMQEYLGIDPKTAYCVDSFGHAATLPQILKKCGFENYVFMRPRANEKTLPQSFIWQSSDGSKILTFRIDESYETRGVEIINHILSAVNTTPEFLDQTMCFFGVGNHGGGPTKAQIEYLLKLKQERKDINIVFSSVDKYFDSVKKDFNKLEVINEELQMHAVGCYTANSVLKRAYRKAENNILCAEKVIALTNCFNGSAPESKIMSDLWDELSFNQFHDILAGSATKEASDEAIMALGKIYVDTENIINGCLRKIISKVDTSGPGGVVFVFNPFPYTLKTYVEYEPWTNWENWESGGWSLSDEEGRAVAYQLIETEENLSFNTASLNRILFNAEVPPMGYRFYRFSKEEKKTDIKSCLCVKHNYIENDFYKLTLDSNSGNIISCKDKKSDIEFVGKEGWNVGEVLEDTSDTWSHNVVKFDKTIGRFGNATIKIVDEGLLQSSLLIEREYENNVWIQNIILRNDSPEIYIKNKFYWRGRFKMVKLGFDINAEELKTYHDVPFGWIERNNNGCEYPTLKWMCAEGKSANGKSMGIGIINDGKYGCDVSGSRMRLSVLRCPPYAYDLHHDLSTKSHCDWLDQGLNEFNILIKPYTGSFEKSGIINRANEFNSPLLLVTNHAHNGKRSKTGSLFQIDNTNIELTAFKVSEDEKGYVLRFVNQNIREESCKIKFINFESGFVLKPFEIKTFKFFEKDEKYIFMEMNLLEKAL
jgi:alpha-mannosidase